MANDFSDLENQYVFEPKPRRVGPAVFLAAATLVALIFASVPFVSFLFRTSHTSSRDTSIDYTEFQTPPDLPEIPPLEKWTNEEPQPLEVLEMESEPLDLQLDPLSGTSLDLALPSVTPGVSTDAFFPEPTDWQVFNQDELERAPQPRFTPQPEYPEALRNKGIVGEVWVHFVIDEEGNVQRPHIGKSTNKNFEAAAIAAISKWTFDPGIKSGTPVKSRAVVPIEFNLEIQLPK